MEEAVLANLMIILTWGSCRLIIVFRANTYLIWKLFEGIGNKG